LLESLQEVKQLVADVQAKFPGQGPLVGAPQLPAPSQVLSVRVEPEQLPTLQAVLLSGYWQAPLPSQPVAPQVASEVEQVLLQQLPLPLTPHTPELH
jgi:hypothetical protein